MKIRLTLTVNDKEDKWGFDEVVKLYKENALDVIKNEIEEELDRFYDQAEVKLEVIGGRSSRGIKQSDNSKPSKHGNSVVSVQE